MAAILRFPATRAGGGGRARTSAEEDARARKAGRVGKDVSYDHKHNPVVETFRRNHQLFICKLITDTIDSQNIVRLTGLDFDLMADILDVRIDGTFI